jgi:hypothetical protein
MEDKRGDPANPCHAFEAGWPRGDCETDGHYLCRGCRNRNPAAAPDFFEDSAALKSARDESK